MKERIRRLRKGEKRKREREIEKEKEEGEGQKKNGKKGGGVKKVRKRGEKSDGGDRKRG